MLRKRPAPSGHPWISILAQPEAPRVRTLTELGVNLCVSSSGLAPLVVMNLGSGGPGRVEGLG
jgi:hypothetical protein